MKPFNYLKNFTYLFIFLAFGCSSSSSDDNDPPGGSQITSITLTLSSTSVQVGDNVSFTVTTNTGSTVTNFATIRLSGDIIPSTGYTCNNVNGGDLTFVAEYNGLTSNTATVSVDNSNVVGKFIKNVLIEDYTGTWCGYCPRVSHAIGLVEDETDRAVIVAVHSDTPFGNSMVPTLENAFGVTGYPTAKLDRTNNWAYPEPNNVNQAIYMTGYNDVGIAMSPSINGNNLSVDVDVKFGDDYSEGNALKLVVYLLEDGLVYNQANYTSYYGGDDPIVGFVHNDVLRAGFTATLGDTIPAGDVVAGNTYSTNLTMPIPSNVADSNNIKVVAMVVNYNNNSAINSREAHFGDTQALEEIN